MKKILELSKKTDFGFLSAVISILALLIMLPVIAGWFFAPAGQTFSGIGSLSPGDNPVYFSYINQIKSGQWLIYDLFTSEPQNYGMFNVFWFMAGKFARVFDLSPIFTFHFLRLLLMPIFVFLLYWFLGKFFESLIYRRLGLVLICFGGGLGAYIIGFLDAAVDLISKKGYWTPNDLWIPESLAFLSLLKTPHFIASWIFLMIILLWLFWAINKNKKIYYFFAGLAALIYFNFHPFYIPMVFLTGAGYLFYEIIKAKKIIWQKCLGFVFFVIISSPSIAYHFWLLSQEPALRLRALQNITLAPPFVFILIGYGLFWIFGAWGAIWLIKNKKLEDKHIFLIIWALVCLALILAPWQFQSRNTQGLQIPLAIFSVFGLFAFYDWLAKKSFFPKIQYLVKDKFILSVIFILMFGSSLAFNLIRDLYYAVSKPKEVSSFFYLKNDNLKTIEFLSNKTEKGVVLGHPLNGLFVGALSLHQVYFAHVIETTDFHSKLLWVGWFYRDDKSWEKKYEFLKKNNIAYIIYGDLEKEIGSFDPDNKAYLQLIYKSGTTGLYRVK